MNKKGFVIWFDLSRHSKESQDVSATIDSCFGFYHHLPFSLAFFLVLGSSSDDEDKVSEVFVRLKPFCFLLQMRSAAMQTARTTSPPRTATGATGNPEEPGTLLDKIFLLSSFVMRSSLTPDS